jgi:hypothetical protein
MRMIPGFVPTRSEGPEDPVLIASSGMSQRMCDNCILADNCPAFEQGAKCAYGFPADIRTHGQVKALLGTMVEIQASRVAFAKMVEDLNGGYPDETVGVEMDRLFKMADQLMRPTKKERLTVSLESESSGGGTGVLSAIFGQRRSAPQEPAPIHVIEQVVSERTD